MKKIFKELAMLGGVVAVSWWLGGMMYFIMVTKHHRDKEKMEDALANIKSYVGGPIASKPTSNPTSKPASNPPSFPRSVESRQWKSDPNNQWKSYNFGRDISGIRPTDNPK